MRTQNPATGMYFEKQSVVYWPQDGFAGRTEDLTMRKMIGALFLMLISDSGWACVPQPSCALELPSYLRSMCRLSKKSGTTIQWLLDENEKSQDSEDWQDPTKIYEYAAKCKSLGFELKGGFHPVSPSPHPHTD
jgi:hypothetical protein